MTFRVLTTCGVFEPGFRGGGPVKSVARIVDTISDDVELLLVTRDRDIGDDAPYPNLSGRWVPRGRSRVFYLDTSSIRQWLQLARSLRADRFDLLYVNSLWSPKFSIVPILAAWLGLVSAKRVLVAPRGELSPGALALKARKKRIFLSAWSRLLRRLDVLWHATSKREADDIAAIFPHGHVEVCPNQTGLPHEPLTPVEHHHLQAQFVFVGRIVPKKNLLLALEALRHTETPLRLDIYGPIEDAPYWRLCEESISSPAGETTVRYLGELQPDVVPATLATYDAFLFPTRGENFSHVIAESLSASCPVICTDTTPWSETLQAGGGVLITERTPETLGAEIERIAAMTAEDRLKGRRMAGDAYRAWRAEQSEDNILQLVARKVAEQGAV